MSKNFKVSKSFKKNCRLVTGQISIHKKGDEPSLSRILGEEGTYHVLRNHKVVKGELTPATNRDFLSKERLENTEQVFIGKDQVLVQELHVLVEEEISIPVSLISCLKRFKEHQNKNYSQFKEFIISGTNAHVEDQVLVFGNSLEVCLPTPVLKAYLNLMNPNTNLLGAEFIQASNFHGMFDRITVESAEKYVQDMDECISVIEGILPENTFTDFVCDFYGVKYVKGVTSDGESISITLEDDFFTFDDYTATKNKMYGMYEIGYSDDTTQVVELVPLETLDEDVTRLINEISIEIFNFSIDMKPKSIKDQTPLFEEKFPCFPSMKLKRKVQTKLEVADDFELGVELDLRKKYFADYDKKEGSFTLKNLTLIQDELMYTSAYIFNRGYDTVNRKFKEENTGFSLVIGANLVKNAHEAIKNNNSFISVTYSQINKENALDTLVGITENRLSAEKSDKNSVNKKHMESIFTCLLEYGYPVETANVAIQACYNRKATTRNNYYTIGEILNL